MKSPKKGLKKATPNKKSSRAAAASRKSSGAVIGDIHKFIELLKINQIELEHQNEELRITEDELQGSRNRYVNLFDFSPIPYFALNQDGFIKKVNINGAKMLGVDRSKLIDKPFSAYVLPEQKRIFTAFIETVFASSEKQSCELSMSGKGKHHFHVLMEAVRLDDGTESEQQCQIALIDMTEYEKLNSAYAELLEKYTSLKASRA